MLFVTDLASLKQINVYDCLIAGILHMGRFAFQYIKAVESRYSLPKFSRIS